jgi:mRNA interferase RelE/StbE
LVWRIELTETAVKQLSKLGKADAKRVMTFLRERVPDDPRASGKALAGPLGDFGRYRVGDYRVICEIQDPAMRVLVVRIGNRREVYR